MATLGAVYDRINNDYLNRTDLTAETKRAVAGAVRFYERQRFWFNETVITGTAATANASLSVPTDMLVLDTIRDLTNRQILTQIDLFTLEELRLGSATGNPTHFCYVSDVFALWPSPTSANLLTINYVRQLPVLSATTATASSNAWFSACEDLIVYHATKTMWANVLRNTEEAMKYAELERREYDQIMMANEQRLYHAIRATRF